MSVAFIIPAGFAADLANPVSPPPQLQVIADGSEPAAAEAGLAVARARLAELTAPPRPAELAAAQATLDQAVARWQGARKAWTHAQELAEDSQDLAGQLIEANTAFERARVAAMYAQAALDTARRRVDRAQTAAERERVAAQVQAAEAQVSLTETVLAGAEDALQGQLDLHDQSLGTMTAVHQAVAAYRQAETDVAAAQAALDLLQDGPAEADVKAAEAGVAQAMAALASNRLQRDALTVTAPQAGTIVARSVEPGELALPGASLMNIADLDTVTLRGVRARGPLG